MRRVPRASRGRRTSPPSLSILEETSVAPCRKGGALARSGTRYCVPRGVVTTLREASPNSAGSRGTWPYHRARATPAVRTRYAASQPLSRSDSSSDAGEARGQGQRAMRSTVPWQASTWPAQAIVATRACLFEPQSLTLV